MEDTGNSEIVKEDIITRNLELLDRRYGHPDPSRKSADERTEQELRGFSGGDISMEGNTVVEWVKIVYNTKTGQIQPLPEKYSWGDFSILHTNLETSPAEGRTVEHPFREGNRPDNIRQLMLYHRGDFPTPQQYTSAIAGEQVGPVVEDRRILPERLYTREEVKEFDMGPDDPTAYQGIIEPWSESKLLGYPSEPSDMKEYDIRVPKPAPGDETLLASVRKFNEKYGPPR